MLIAYRFLFLFIYNRLCQERGHFDMKKKKSTALLISAIIGIGYSIYLVVYFAGVIGGSGNEAEAIGGSIATALVTPHMICVIIAAIFNTLGWANNKRGFALVGAILYCVAAALFVLYAMFLIPSIILSFVGFANLKKINAMDDQIIVGAGS